MLSCIKIKQISLFFSLLYATQSMSASHRTTYDVEHLPISSRSTNTYSFQRQYDTCTQNTINMHRMFDNIPQLHQAPEISHPFSSDIAKAAYAFQLLYNDHPISNIKHSIDQQLLSIARMLNSGAATTFDRFMMVKQLHELATSFDSYYQTLQIQHQKINHTSIIDTDIAHNLYAVQCLREELHNLLNSIKIEFFDKQGNFLDKDPNSLLLNRARLFFHNKTINDLITTYRKQYEHGHIKIISSPDLKRLQLIENNPFNKALYELDACLKQGNLDQANRICEQFAPNKKFSQTLQSFKASSKDLNEFVIPKMWEAHPKWQSYKSELQTNSHKVPDIIQILQQDHNNALTLCTVAGIGTPTEEQLNYAHQLYQYQSDTSFIDIASQGLQNSSAFELAKQTFENHAHALKHIEEIATQNPHCIPLLQEHINDLLPFDHDPNFESIISEMVHNPDAINNLKDELLQRDLYVQKLRNQLGHEFFSGQAEQVAYQLADAHNNTQRIEILSTLSSDHPHQEVQDAYYTFYDTTVNLPKIFHYDQQLLETLLPACIGMQEFTQERTLYTHIMTQPIQCNEQRMQVEQCISFLHDACIQGELQSIYRDLACTAAKTYIKQSYNCSPADHAEQVALFDRAYKAIEQGHITQADIADQSVQTRSAQHTNVLTTSADYQQLHGHVTQQCTTLQNKLGSVPEYYQSRDQALKQVIDGNNGVCTQRYELSPHAEKILEKHDIDTTQFTHFTGNLLQQDTNAKFVDTLNRLAQKTATTSTAQQIKEGVLECVQAGSQLNQQGNLQEAMVLSDMCHIAVDYLWHGLEIGKGVAEGVYFGVSHEITNALRDPHISQEVTLVAGSSTPSSLSHQAATETAMVISDLVRFTKDSGEVAFSFAAGVGDAIIGFPELATHCCEAVKLVGQCVGHIGHETMMLLDAAERKDVVQFEQQLHKMQNECGQVVEGIGQYLAHLKAQKNAVDGIITKEDAKNFAQASGRFITEAIICSQVMNGTSHIMRGTAQYVRSTEHALPTLRTIRDLSGAKAREILLAAQCEAAAPLQSIASSSGTRGIIEQVAVRSSSIPQVVTNSVAHAVQENIASAAVQQSEIASSSSLAQRVGQFISLEPKPGFIAFPGMNRNETNTNTSTQLWEQLQSAQSINEKHEIFLKVDDIKLLEDRVNELCSVVSDNRPGELHNKIGYLKFIEFEEKLPTLWDQIRMRTDDVSKIVETTKIPEHIIQRIKEHVFVEEHILDRGIARFDPDADMFQAWMRLVNGDYVQSDLRLLQHEFAESFLMQGKAIAYSPAHGIINQVYNWDKFLI